jgi:glycosyltransferase involved in cell wall biosynthesis
MFKKNNMNYIQELGNNQPLVSIGMPVFNGEKYIAEAVTSILNQTFTNFELIISDNASTDRTEQICLEYASKDNRIHYYRNEKNIGAPKNYNKVFEISNSKYFKWAAYDDVLHSEYLRKCVNVLEKDAAIVGCHSKTARIDKDRNFLGYYNKNYLLHINSPKAHERFRDLIGLYYITTPFHAVYRASSFGKSQLHGSYVGADRNLVAELGLMGRIYEIPECLFFWRDHPDSYTSRFYGNNREDTLDRLIEEAAWWSKDSGSYFPHWKNCIEYFKSVNRVRLPLLERFLCYIQILDWFMEEGSKFMAKDILLFMCQHSKIASFLTRKVPVNFRASLIP